MARATKAQSRCGERGHWQVMELGTGEVISKDCVYCGLVVNQGRHKVDVLARATVYLCAAFLGAATVYGISYLTGVAL